MSVTAAKGFVASGIAAGIRRRDRKDVALVRSTEPAVGAAMFTRNRVQAACIQVCRDHLAIAEPQAVVVNSGVANAATGERGVLDALATTAEAGRLLGISAEQVLPLSTGVIGARLPTHRLLPGLQAAVLALSPDGGADAAEAVTADRQSLSVGVRNGRLEDVEREESRDLGLRVFVGKRQATVSASDLSPATRARLIERAVAMARLAPEDPYAGLAPEDRLARGPRLVAQHGDLFRRIEAKYGVPGAVLVAFWGLETDFGSDLGKYKAPTSVESSTAT